MTIQRTTIETFIAFDGKEFKTEQECTEYEKSISELQSMIPVLKKIRKLCYDKPTCKHCMFYNNYSDGCLLKEDFPENWDLESIGD